MKKIKKALAIALTAAMVMAMSPVSYAAEGDGYTVTITANTQDKGTHTYGAYQIFKGDLTEDGTLSNIQWGSGISDAGKTALGDASDYAKNLTEANAATKAAELAQYLTTAEKTGSDKIEGLTGGYYLIQDENDSPTGDSPNAKTKYILEVVGDVTVEVKSSVPSVVKKVQDINDSSSDESASAVLTELQDSADYDIGDSVPYHVTGTIGSGIDNFDSYSFQFVDTMSKGLTLDESSWDIEVDKKDGTAPKSIKSLFTLTSGSGEDGAKVWTWAAVDIKPEIAAGSEVILTYKCTLNKDAVIGEAGNPNTVKLKFDNNPNSSGQGNPGGETPEDKNIVFTYKTVFNKVRNKAEKAVITVEEYNELDENTKANYDAVEKDGVITGYKSQTELLTGADFKLEKKVEGSWVDVTSLGSGENKPTKTGSTEGAVFEFKGLDDGDYRLTEITTPGGYNTIDPIEFKITAEHDITSDDPKLTKLTGTDGAEFTMTPNISEGSLTVDVINEKGATLPSTGGMGTTLFYIIGGALVAVAGALLVFKKRGEN